MSNIERRKRIDELKERLFFDIKDKGLGGGAQSGYGAPNIPSYNAPAPAPSYNEPLPSYGAPGALPSFGTFDGFGFNKGPGKVIEIPVPDLPIPDPLEFKAAVLRSKGRIASGLLHTKAGILRAGANILAQKANALDKFAQAIPAIKANLINSIKDIGGGVTNQGGGYGAPPPQNGYQAPTGPQGPGPTQPQPSTGYGVPIGNPIGPSSNNVPQTGYNNNNGGSFNGVNSVQPQNNNPTYNSGTNIPSNNNFNGQNSVTPINNGNSVVNNNNFRPSNQDTYGSPTGGVITNQPQSTSFSSSNPSNSEPLTLNSGLNSGNFAVGSSLSFGSNNGNNFQQQNTNNYNSGSVTSVIDPRLKPQSNNQISSSNGFSPLTQSTFDQASGGNSNPKRNVFGTVSGQVNPGQMTTITLNDLNTLRQNTEKLILQESRQQVGRQQGNNFGQCQATGILNELLQDIFMGNEVIPDIIDAAPRFPLDLTYKTIRTYPGMRVTADMTRFKPMLKWPAQPDSLYTIVLSNLDINSRRNRTLSEFWHWFVANVPGDSVDDGEVIFDLLFPLVLPEGDGDHRYGYFVFEQPRQLDYAEEGGPTDSCSPQMSNGRGPFKSTKNFMKKYNLDLTAATFLIIDSNEASMEIACEWQKCIGDTINLVSPLQCGKK